MENPIKIINGKIVLERELTKDDFVVVRQETENSVCFILDIADDFWQYQDYINKVEAKFSIRIKGYEEINNQLNILFNNQPSKALSLVLNKIYWAQITQTQRKIISKKCNSKNIEKIKQEIDTEIKTQDLENKFYEEVIEKVKEGINKLNKGL